MSKTIPRDVMVKNVCLALVSALPLMGAVYEPFDYPKGPLANQNGGMGFAGPWRDGPGTVTAAESLEPDCGYPLQSTGGHFTGSNPNWRSVRMFATPLGATQGTVWLSFLIRNDTALRKDTYGFVGLIDQKGNGAKFGQPHWGDQWALMGPKDVKSGVPSNNAEPAMVVMQLDFGEGENTDAVRVYVNPDTVGETGTARVEVTGVALGVLDRVCLQCGTDGRAFSYDEIRIGSSFAEVAPPVVDAHGKPLARKVDWASALRLDELKSNAGWAVAPGGTGQFSATIRNTDRDTWDGVVRFELCTASGNVLKAQEHALALPSAGTGAAAASMVFSGCTVGEHLVRVRLLRGPADDRRQDTGWEHSVAVAGPEDAFILFDREPVMRGMTFDRKNMSAKEIVTGGLRRWVWFSRWNSAEVGWWRSVKMTLTDERLRHGRAPVVDIVASWCQTSDAPVHIAADVASGGGPVAEGWGGRGPDYDADPPFRVLCAEIDDALFAATTRPSADDNDLKIHCNGHDLRLNSCTADGRTRAVFVHPVDRTNNPDWSRLLRVLGADAGVERCVWEPGTVVEAKVRLANRAAVPYTATARVRLCDDRGREVWSRDLPVEVAAGQAGTVPVTVETTGFAHGVYPLTWQIGSDVEAEVYLTVADAAPLPKAADGEFLYGIDATSNWDDTRMLDWADWCGFDIIRNCARRGDADLDAAVATMKARGLRATLMIDPPWDAKRETFEKKIADVAARAGQMAAKHADFFYWYELGNEPDLPFFYRGEPADYVKAYVAIHDAIKGTDPTSVVMNGGLCFHSAVGLRRAHELVRLIPGDKIDAWAYHGHGPGAKAERNAWERQQRATRSEGKDGIPFIETESGFSVRDLPTCRGNCSCFVLSRTRPDHVAFRSTFHSTVTSRRWAIRAATRSAYPLTLPDCARRARRSGVSTRVSSKASQARN